MKDGFIKVATGLPKTYVADVSRNTEEICNIISEADQRGINLLVLPELCVTGYTCGDLFFSEKLISAAENALKELADFTAGKYPCVILGLPLKYRSKLYNCAAVLCGGKILGIAPKGALSNYNEFYEKRQFTSGDILPENAVIDIFGSTVPFGTDLLFCHNSIAEYTFSVQLCDDIMSSNALFEGNAVVNTAASTEAVGKAERRKTIISALSQKHICGYICAGAGTGESTQDSVFSGHSLIYENGRLLAENKPFEVKSLTVTELDLKKIAHERHNNTSFLPNFEMRRVAFEQRIVDTRITREIKRLPFLPTDNSEYTARAEEILQIQSHALSRRIEHTHSKTAVIGISGGLDSTLALLCAVRAMELLKRPMTDITAITMPCFGTTKRTRSNSEILCNGLGVNFREVNIASAVKQHFADIGQSEESFDVVYENSQARERTQVLMDIANMENGIVVGTGDLSELALGWATYNGDHMSMYAVNCDIPKTLIKLLVSYEAERLGGELGNVLRDILDTPVSPELLPADSKGEIAQKTEDLVGPYELHDFFLYHTVRYGESPKKIFRMAKIAFPEYADAVILKWLKVFTRRFFNQQFKRSCVPDGPKIGSVALSPRGDWRMPTDAFSDIWLKEIEEVENELN